MMKSVIGSHNLIMAGAHVAHDCIVGDRVILANAATLAGHVWIGDHATVGAFCGVHQFCRVGCYAFIGGYSVLTRDALPFVKTVGYRNKARTYGINRIGLERLGFSQQRQETLVRAYRLLFHQGIRLKEAIRQLRAEDPSNGDVDELLSFIESSERGFVR
jgi:UDP-N-acetylglucosamine acyltransferase